LVKKKKKISVIFDSHDVFNLFNIWRKRKRI